MARSRFPYLLFSVLLLLRGSLAAALLQMTSKATSKAPLHLTPPPGGKTALLRE
jgi:hypothetical protein